MSSPYWSDPATGETGPATWEQPPGPAWSPGGWSDPVPAEPTVPLDVEPPAWPGSATTAPLLLAEQPRDHQRAWDHQQAWTHQPAPEQHRWPAVPAQGRQPYLPPGPPVHAHPYPSHPYPGQHPHQDLPVTTWSSPGPTGYGPRPGEVVLWSERSRAAAAVLAFFLGLLGVHNFYLGHVGRGVVQLVLSLTGFGLAVTWIWVVVEFVLILTGGLRDRSGRLLR